MAHEPSGPPGIRYVGTVLCGLLVAVGCARYALLTPQAVERVPPAQYRVTVSRSGGANREYSAVLFETAKAAVTLDLPRTERLGVATPEDYSDALKVGSLVYELRDVAGTVKGYLIAPADARVMAWEQNASKGRLVVAVSGRPSVPEAGGGGGM